MLLLREVENKFYKFKQIWNGKVYPDKLRWLGYDPDSGRCFFVDDMNDPRSDPLRFMYEVKKSEEKSKELRYMVGLGEWWKAVNSGKIQVAASERHHSLIGERPCNEFFDCSVEVSNHSIILVPF